MEQIIESKGKVRRMREFLATCPYLDVLSKNIHVDWTDNKPTNYGIMPTGSSGVMIIRNVNNEYLRFTPKIKRSKQGL